jgi:hypothetical protein
MTPGAAMKISIKSEILGTEEEPPLGHAEEPKEEERDLGIRLNHLTRRQVSLANDQLGDMFEGRLCAIMREF